MVLLPHISKDEPDKNQKSFVNCLVQTTLSNWKSYHINPSCLNKKTSNLDKKNICAMKRNVHLCFQGAIKLRHIHRCRTITSNTAFGFVIIQIALGACSQEGIYVLSTITRINCRFHISNQKDINL